MNQFLVILIVCGAAVCVSPLSLDKHKRISNGFPANITHYPYIASLQFLGYHFCGCTIIQDVWLLTAAHCINQALLNTNFLRVVAGISTLNTGSLDLQTSKVLRQYRHPLYKGGTGPNNIGLIRIKTPFTWSTTVGFAFLPYPDDEFSGVAEIAGWGYLNSTHPDPNRQLQYASVYIIGTNGCNSILGRYNLSVDSHSICVTGHNFGNETSCKGDSGGPLIHYNVNNYPIAIGIMSWNLSPCGLNGSPSVSAKISKYIEWILCCTNDDFRSSTDDR